MRKTTSGGGVNIKQIGGGKVWDYSGGGKPGQKGGFFAGENFVITLTDKKIRPNGKGKGGDYKKKRRLITWKKNARVGIN